MWTATGRRGADDMPMIKILQLDRLFIGAASTAELLERALSFLVAEVGVDGAWFGAPDADGHFHYDAMIGGGVKEYLAGVKISVNNDTSGVGPAGRAWRSGKMVIADDFLNEPWSLQQPELARQVVLRAGWQASAAIPIRDGAFYILSLYSRTKGFFNTLEKRPLIEHLVATMGFALERQSLISESKRRHRALQKLNLIYQALIEEEKIHFEASNAAELMDGTCRQLVKTGLFDLVGLAWPDDDRIIRYHYASGTHSQELIDQFYSALDGNEPGTLSREVLRTGKVLFSNDYLHDIRSRGFHQAARKLGIKAWAAFPIQRSGMLWGVMSVTAGDRDVFDQDTVALLTSSAQLLGRALDAFDLRARLERLNSLYRSLMTQGEIVLSASNEETLFAETCRKLADGGLFDAAFIVPASDDRSRLSPLAQAFQNDARDVHTAEATKKLIDFIFQRYKNGACAINNLLQSGCESATAQAVDRMDWKSAAAATIKRGHRPYAHLVIVARQVDLFDTEVISLVGRITELLHRALDQIDVKRHLDVELAQQAWLALHDPLTSLYNRAGLDVHFDKSLARVQRTGGTVNVIMLDIDDFKVINDTFGHAAGDEILAQIAHRLVESVRQSDFVARLGGDEFIIVVEDLLREVDCVALLERLSSIWQLPCRLPGGTEIYVSGSFGLSKYMGGCETPDAVFRRADEALYQTKKRKNNRTTCWHIHEDATREVVL